MLITKCLLLFLFLYGNNIVETTDTSASSSPGFVACAGSGGVNGAFNLDWTASGETACSDHEGLKSGAANQPVDPATQLKVFKDDPDGNEVEIQPTEYYKDQYLGNLTYAFKPGVKCTLVKFGDKDVWKKGDEEVDEPKSVTYDSVLGEVAVRDAKKSVVYKRDDSGNWVYHDTIDRPAPDNSAKSSGQAGSTGSSGSGLSLPKPESETGSGTGLRGTPAPTDTNEEADETSTVSSPEAGSTNEVSTGTGLRGTSVSAEASEEAEQTSTVSSPEAGTTNESGQGATREENETDDGGGKEATTDADGSSASASDDAGSTGGEGSGHVAGGSSATPPASSGGDGTSGGADSDGGGTDTSSGEGSGTNDDGTGTGTGEHTETGGEGEDGSSQPSGGDGGSKTGEDDTGTSGGDGGTQLSTTPTSGGTDQTSGSDGSSSTPPASSGGDGTSATPGQGGTATSPTAGDSESSTKTCVELSLKAKEATNEFDYKKDGNVVTYTAKDKYGFKSVKTGKNGDIVVWSTDNASEYATKVVLNGKGKKQKDVTIHQPDGTKKVFKRAGKDKPWSEVSQQSNQSTGQPASGTPASGSNGMTGGDDTTGGRRMSSSSQGMTGVASQDANGYSQGGGGSPPADGGSGTHTSSGEGSGTNDDGTGKGAGEGTQKSDLDGSSATPPGSPASDGTSGSSQPTEGSQSAGDGGSKTDQGDGGIKLFGNDSKNPNETVELNDQHYDLKILGGGNRIDYDFKENVQCTLIKMDGKELWKHGDHKCNENLKSVSYRYGYTIVIHLGNGFVQYIKSNNTWNVEFEINLKSS